MFFGVFLSFLNLRFCFQFCVEEQAGKFLQVELLQGPFPLLSPLSMDGAAAFRSGFCIFLEVILLI